MKKLIILLILLSTAATAQVQIQTMYDITRADGQRFIIRWPYGITMNLADSLYIPAGDSVLQVREGCYSQRNSTMTVRMQRMRIVAGDTIIKYDNVTVPFSALGNNISQLLTGAVTKKALKPTCKTWIKYKLNQE